MLLPLILMLFVVLYMSYEKKEYPTLDKLLQVLKAKMLFNGGRISLEIIERKIGFRYKKNT